ncbi:permease [Burkholderia ubonensis]|uniref:Permease n=2 Tax=Burkholderia cepacia complex TaxID=87882 RepID=A0AAW3MM94_9BURK|nr:MULTISPECIES: DMT family transporter [Burkholderia cepacia complex]AOK20778.1 permease [Burkholderia cepacia]AOK27546.1 permease [Burkholderia ubonensis]KVC74428.1 permease [Burkholderia ubonensis]KVC84901.1 permease [Burkholderia ubonensis]KVD27069.1 permease [Burkholderia ubonensis]
MIGGILAGLATGALWGLTFVAPRAVAPFSAIDLAIARYLVFGVASIALMLWPAFRPRGIGLKPSLVAILLGSVGYIGYFLAASFAVRYAGATVPPLVIGLLPVALAIIGNWTNADVRWSRLIVPLAMICAGVLLINVRAVLSADQLVERNNVLLGVLCAYIALAIWIAYGVINAKALRAAGGPSPLVWTGLQGMGSGLGTLPLFVVASLGTPSMLFNQDATAGQWAVFLGWAVVMGIAGSWVATWCWSIASRKLPLSLSAQLIVAETVFGLAYGFIYEHRWPALAEWTGIALQMVGVAVAIAVFTSRPTIAPDARLEKSIGGNRT